MLEKGDYVCIKHTEGRTSYSEVVGHIGRIVDIKYERYLDDEHYTFIVKLIDSELTNKYRKDGYFVFHYENSLYKVGMISMCPVEAVVTIDKEINIQKEVNNMNKQSVEQQNTLQIYFSRKEQTYNVNRHNKIKKVYDNSKAGKLITYFIKSLKDMGVSDNDLPKFDSLWLDKYLTNEELKLIDNANNVYHTAMANLNQLCEECEAILNTCETFDQKMKVLQNFNIINDNYNLNA